VWRRKQFHQSLAGYQSRAVFGFVFSLQCDCGRRGLSADAHRFGLRPECDRYVERQRACDTFVNGNQLTAQVTAGDIAAPGIAQITVSNPAPGGGVSNVFRFGVNPASPPPNFLYVGNVGGSVSFPSTISGYSIDPNSGALTALADSPFTPSPYLSSTIPGPMGMDTLGKFLYVANAPFPNTSPICQSCTTFAGFTPNSSGDLVPLAGSPLFTQVPNAFVGDPTGNILYDSGGPGASQNSDIVTMLIDADTGALTPVADSPAFGVFIAMALNGTFLYGAGNPFISSSPGGIWTGSINFQTGNVLLVATPKTQGGLGAQALAVHPSGKFLFAVGGATLFAYAIDPATGELKLQNSISYSSIIGETVTDVVVHLSGRFLYTNLSVFNEILGFSIDGDGNLTPLLGSPFDTVAAPGLLATDPAGKYLYVTSGGFLDGFTVDANSGALTQISGFPLPLPGTFPGEIVITP
jgi:6-phosphogluconolactonase (cycloisomerase 2 family)